MSADGRNRSCLPSRVASANSVVRSCEFLVQSLGHVVIMIVPREYEGSNNTHRLHRTHWPGKYRDTARDATLHETADL
jgi:hypothetical protein